MLNILVKPFKGFIKRQIEKKLNDPEFKASVIKIINDNIDIPHLDEKAEAELFDHLIEQLKVLILAYLSKI